MKRLQKAIVSLGVVAVLLSGSSSVFAKKSESSKSRIVGGVVVSVDRTTRTIALREGTSGETIRVKVPAGRYVRTNQQGLALASFEQLLPGMFIRDMSVQ